jgi:hypothetical protein
MFTRRDGLQLALAAAAAGTRPSLVLPARAEVEPAFKLPPLGYGSARSSLISIRQP